MAHQYSSTMHCFRAGIYNIVCDFLLLLDMVRTCALHNF